LVLCINDGNRLGIEGVGCVGCWSCDGRDSLRSPTGILLCSLVWSFSSTRLIYRGNALGFWIVPVGLCLMSTGNGRLVVIDDREDDLVGDGVV
jgi:hypothetical protein